MRVTQTIQSADPFNTGEVEAPVETTYYNGDDLAQAMSALMSAAADKGDRFYRVLSVHLHIQDPEV